MLEQLPLGCSFLLCISLALSLSLVQNFGKLDNDEVPKDRMLKLHLGCGKRYFGKDWVHVDSRDFPHVVAKDILNLNYEDDSVDVIYASHVIEYFDRDEVVHLLHGWKRKMKDGGTLRLAVPDFEVLAKLYIENNAKLSNIIGPLYGKMRSGDVLIYHKTIYDFDSLSEVLFNVGFKNIRKYDWRHTEHASFDDHSQAYLPHMDKENGTLISLNVECDK